MFRASFYGTRENEAFVSKRRSEDGCFNSKVWSSNHNQLSAAHTPSHDASDFHHAHPVMHRHTMVKIEDSPKKLTPGHSFALSCMYTQNQLRPDQPFYSSYQDTLGIYLNRNCLVVRGGGAYPIVSRRV